MSEPRLLSAALDRTGHRIVSETLDESELSPQAFQLLGILGKFYENHPGVSGIDRESATEWVKVDCANPKHAEDFAELIASLPDVESPEAVAAVCREQKLKATRLKLAAALSANNEDEMDTLLLQLENLRKPLDETHVDLTDLDTFMGVFQQVDASNKIRLWPKRLQEKTGGALPGHHIVLYGRPERGKTLMTVNMVAGFLYDGHKVLYIGNEDPIVSIQSRIASRLVGCTTMAFEENPADYHDRLVERGLGRLRAERLSPGSVREIEDLIREFEPTVLVVDQLRNLKPRGKGGDNITSRIDTAAQEVRELLGRYGLLGVSIAQAGSGEYGENDRKAFLTESDIDSSKTGLPGACDLLIGIGATEEMLNTGQRGLSLCKNKLNGCHDNFLVRFDIQRNKVE